MNNTKNSRVNDSCLLLLNVGTPDSPEKEDVKRYLNEFLNDPMVLDYPSIFRKILVNGIIIPFRIKTSVQIYQSLWNKYGRVLDVITSNLVARLQQKLAAKNIDVKYAMRYGNPSMESVFDEITQLRYKELIVLPMFPQDSMSTVGTVNAKIQSLMKKSNETINIRTIKPFYNNDLYTEAIVSRVKKNDLSVYDYIIFSYHGLPNRHLRRTHKEKGVYMPKDSICCNDNANDCEAKCYRSSCYETTERVAKALGLSKQNYTTAFQSRLSRNWMRPFCDELIEQKAKEGVKKILVFALSFTIDCLETVNEIGEEYKEMFLRFGGEVLDLVPALNDTDEMVVFIDKLIESKSKD